jgi:hypothetical protein
MEVLGNEATGSMKLIELWLSIIDNIIHYNEAYSL